MKKWTIMTIALAVVVGGASASITTTYTDMGNMSSTVDKLTNTLTVAKGDVVVMVGASNKKASATLLTFTSSAGAVTDLSTDTQIGGDPNPNSYLSYIIIPADGTYDFIGTTSILGLTANLGTYTLSADSGLIELAGSNAKKYSGLGPEASLSVTNFMSWGSNPNAGLYDGITTVGVGSSLRGNMTTTTLTLDEDNSFKRLIGTSDRTGFNNEKHIWDITNASTTQTESGGITGAAFAEVIPEPATLGMISIAGILLLIRRRLNRS